MNEPFPRPLLYFGIFFFLCAGVLVFLGVKTDASLGTVPASTGLAASSGSGPSTGIRILGFGFNTTLFVGLVALLVFVYFFPAINAQYRQHRERKAITVLNIFLGWTFLGWIVALVWSFTSQVDPEAKAAP